MQFHAKCIYVALFFAAIASCFGPTTGPCVDADPADDGELVGWLEAHDGRWRVQLHELPEHCSGVTTWDALHGNRVSFAPNPEPRDALHELGHVLLGRHHLEDEGAIMHAVYRAHDLTAADLAYCRDEGVCPADGRVIAAPTTNDESPAGVVAWASLRWNGVTNPDYRLRFSPVSP